MIEQLDFIKEAILGSFGEIWILVGIIMLFYFTVVNMVLQDPAAAFVITAIPFSLIIIAGIISAQVASYMLIGLALILALSMSRLFIK